MVLKSEFGLLIINKKYQQVLAIVIKHIVLSKSRGKSIRLIWWEVEIKLKNWRDEGKKNCILE